MGLEYKEVPQVDKSIDDNFTEFISFMTDEEQQEINTRLAVIKSQKIVNEYDKQLKDIRSDLRNLSFEYEVLEETEDYVKPQVETIDKLNTVIDKVEILKGKMSKEDLKNYDDDYLYVLVEQYLKDLVIDGIIGKATWDDIINERNNT